MPDESTRLFDAVHRFKKLALREKLGLIPESELVILMAVLSAGARGDKRQCSVTEIARQLHVSPPAISRTLRRLREKHFVETIPDEADRRNLYIMVTGEGMAALDANRQKVSGLIGRALAHLEPGELDAFYRLFDKIYWAVRQELDTMGPPVPAGPAQDQHQGRERAHV
nr:MarR family transcriptional regulator [bacterium]